jgi:hypothetical protein
MQECRGAEMQRGRDLFDAEGGFCCVIFGLCYFSADTTLGLTCTL